MKKMVMGIVLVLFMSVIFSCSHVPTLFGDKILKQSEHTKELGLKWKKGKKLVQRGEKIREEGQKEVQQGQETVQKGEKMISQGQQMIGESERNYNERFPNPPPVQP